MEHVSLDVLLDEAVHLKMPDKIDAIRFIYRGVDFHVFGVLHGMTGATNRVYRDLIARTIVDAPGAKLGEREFCRIYRGLDCEMCDWLQIPLRDNFMLALKLTLLPNRLISMLAVAFKELATAADRFGENGCRRLQDIGGSPAFHLLSPSSRRRYAGFPAPAAYLRINLQRRRGQSTFRPPIFPDRDWSWMSMAEPWINIPCRSIHMLEYAAEWALIHDRKVISLFVGEIHNSDMEWLVNSGLSDLSGQDADEVAQIRKDAVAAAHAVSLFRRISFKASTYAGIAVGLGGQATMFAFLYYFLR